MDADLEKQLRVLLDKEEIRSVMARHAHAGDRGDRDLFRSCFHEDAVRLTPRGRGDSSHELDAPHGVLEPTPAAQMRGSGERSSDALPQMHFLGNPYIEIDGDVAFSETYFVAWGEIRKDGKMYTRSRAGRYLDRFERRNGAWKIAYRVMTDDWSRLDEVLARVESPTSFPAKATREDPFYELLLAAPPTRS